jgi:hypothetical protein
VLLSDPRSPILESIFQQFVEWCDIAGVPIVLAAGNDPLQSLDLKTPPKAWGNDQHRHYGRWSRSGWKPLGSEITQKAWFTWFSDGSLTVFAPAIDIVVPGGGNLDNLNTGTSQAAAIVVSLSQDFVIDP